MKLRRILRRKPTDGSDDPRPRRLRLRRSRPAAGGPGAAGSSSAIEKTEEKPAKTRVGRISRRVRRRLGRLLGRSRRPRRSLIPEAAYVSAGTGMPAPRWDGPPDTPAVASYSVIKRFGDGPAAVEALRGVTLSFGRATFSAIVGPSGSGKSTLMHLLAGLDKPSGGQIELGGVKLAGLNDDQLTELRRERVGFVFQSFNLLPTLNAEENISLPLLLAGVEPDPIWIDTLLTMFGITDRRSHRPAELSGGQQQRVALARALVTRPSVVFADEPTGNLDSVASDEVLRLLRRAVVDYGQTVVMVTHDPVAAAHADRVVELADGRVVSDLQTPDPPPELEILRRR
ncbi:MAG TPA: ABC transporter ATP-binding protein [Solirubrobacteraceae bacterium]|nr:ABC transporter ATP-binding protein [Solirubrobacteraceae bacterium]